MSKIVEIHNKIQKTVLDDSLDIRYRLLNLILTILLFGTLIGFLFSILFVNDSLANVITLLVAVAISLGLFISIKLKKSDLAAILASLTVNAAIFPVMYITQGGMGTGMPIWMLLGLTFNWLVLHGFKCYMTFGIELIIDISLFVFETKFPEKISSLPPDKMTLDFIQGIFMVAIIIGILFKFQAYVYDKQKQRLEEREALVEKALRELELANQAKSAFLANMSHEIRTPINAVLGMDELILRGDINPSVREYANNIERSGKMLLSLINDILDLSKIESGKMEILEEDYSLMDLIMDCYINVNVRAQEKGLSFNVNCNENTASKLHGDVIKIRQILNNILTNAVKYTQKGNVNMDVTYEIIDDDEIELIVAISDTGIGIAEKNIDILFDSFKRINEKKNKGIEGTGLGLSITKQLVDLMNGIISVDSEVDKGTTFTVRIPQFVVDHEPIGSFSAYSTKELNTTHVYHESFIAPDARILAVDDVELNLKVVGGLLQNTKVQMDFATSGAQCIELVKKNFYNIILMDHMMPEMDGMETLNELKRLKLIDDRTVVLALTANAISGVRDNYLNAGFKDYYTKPIAGKILEEALLKYLPPQLILPYEENETKNDMNAAAAGLGVEKEAKEKSPEEIIIDKLREKSFIDVDLGLQYCGGKPETYLALVRDFCNSSMIANIKKAYKAQDYEKYKIRVHGLKSTSLALGLSKLSESAKALEFACKEDRIEYVLDNHDQFMAEYKKLLMELIQIID